MLANSWRLHTPCRDANIIRDGCVCVGHGPKLPRAPKAICAMQAVHSCPSETIMRNFEVIWAFLPAILAASSSSSSSFDLVVFGATPGGIMTAIAAARNGAHTVLVEPSSWIGGMLTGGLSHSVSDFDESVDCKRLSNSNCQTGRPERKQDLASRMRQSQDIGDATVIGGLALELFERMGLHYSDGKNTTPVACYDFEPHVASETVALMLTEADVQVITGAVLQSVTTSTISGARMVAAIITGNGTFSAPLFADGTYNGDLAAAAGADMTWGREAIEQYGESLAGARLPDRQNRYQFEVPVTNFTSTAGSLLPLIQQPPGPQGSADNRTQAYCFRLCMTTNQSNQLPIAQPPNPEQWLGRWDLLRNYMAAIVSQKGTAPALDDIVTIRYLPHSKADWNVGSAVNMDVVGFSWGFPNGTAAERAEITAFHEEYTRELLWVLANDPGIPTSVRASMADWGYCADEFQDSGGFPPYLYIREGMRLVGASVLNQTDRTAPRTWPDCIGFGSYSLDCHDVTLFVGAQNLSSFTAGGSTHHAGAAAMQVWEEGELDHGSLPSHFGLPLSAMLPRGAAPAGTSATPEPPPADASRSGPRRNAGSRGPANLVVPVAASTSHVAFAAVRLEPTWMILGQAAGTAAAQLVAAGHQSGGFANVDVAALRSKLRSQGAIVDAGDIPSAAVPNDGQCPNM